MFVPVGGGEPYVDLIAFPLQSGRYCWVRVPYYLQSPRML